MEKQGVWRPGSCERVCRSGRDPSEVLKLSEEALDEIALAIYRMVDGANEPATGAWNVSPCWRLTDEVKNAVAIIAAVGDSIHGLRSERCEPATHHHSQPVDLGAQSPM
jgi:hypothetical protein